MPKKLSDLIRRIKQSHWLEKDLDEFLEKSRNKDRFPSEYFHPSSIGECNREIQYNMMGIPTEDRLSGANIRVLDQGLYTEKKYHDYFNSMGILVSYQQVVLIQSPPIKGTCDFVIKNPDSGELFLIELKTRREEVARIKWEDLNNPYSQHKIQWQLYAKGLNMVNGMIIYENKNRQALKIFDMVLDEEFVQKIFYRLLSIQKAISLEYTIGKPSICSNFFCNYKEKCSRE